MKAQRNFVKAIAAYVLHSYEYSESSLVLEVWCAEYGRLAVLAKGARKPLSGFRAVLLPLQPLRLDLSLAATPAASAWTEGSEASNLGVLKAAHWGGGAPMMAGDALLAGLYMNELLLRMLPRDDPHPSLYALYHDCIQAMASAAWQGQAVQTWVRLFELGLLRATGYLPELRIQASSHSSYYGLQANLGLVASTDATQGLAAEHWQALGDWLQLWMSDGVSASPVQSTETTEHTRLSPAPTLLAVLGSRSLREQLRRYIEQLPLYGNDRAAGAQTLSPLRSRQFMHEVQALLG